MAAKLRFIRQESERRSILGGCIAEVKSIHLDSPPHSGRERLPDVKPHFLLEPVDYHKTWVWNLPLLHARGLNEKQIPLLQKDLEIFTLGDLFHHYPFRYEDRSIIHEIRDFHFGLSYIQCVGEFKKFEILGEGKGRRLIGHFYDRTGVVEVVWFQKIETVRNAVKINVPYLVYGKLQHYLGKSSFVHPEIEAYKPDEPRSGLESIYSSSETLKRFGLDSKGLGKVIRWNLKFFKAHLKEPFSDPLIRKWGLMPLPDAIWEIHTPGNDVVLEAARIRLKTEELFPLQFFLLRKKTLNHTVSAGFTFPKLEIFNRFYHETLPFPLTGAQKKVLRELRHDTLSGKQMNRLIQGDVGSGKTIVAFMAMLMAIDNGYQACLMAPTEILANQHFVSISALAGRVQTSVALLTGSTKTAERKRILAGLENGTIHLLIGTHSLIEETVQFQQLGLSVVDEQHRFGVAQRAKLHTKNQNSLPPHILIMTATPIPRTLAMSLYGDLDISVIDELPPGRKEIKTVHRTEGKRLKVFGFIREQIEEGRQVYIVYPMIEESETLDLNNLMEGFESISRAFPNIPVSMVHGKMKPEDKDFEMRRFLKGETKIMVATTVIEVGVNVPNASIMIVENAERFGLTQLHQLRGRVGRGEYQSYCILMTGQKVSKDGKVRIETMCRTNNGFEIAETDLKLRGPGDMMGTKQSGITDLKLTNLSDDGDLIEKIRSWVAELVETDINLNMPDNQFLKTHLTELHRNKFYWSNIA